MVNVCEPTERGRKRGGTLATDWPAVSEPTIGARETIKGII